MKKFFTYLLCGLCLTSPVLAQTTGPVVVQPPTGSDPGAPDPTPADPTRATLDNLFAPLDKSQVPTGFLAEDGWLTGSWHPHYKSYLSFRTQKRNT